MFTSCSFSPVSIKLIQKPKVKTSHPEVWTLETESNPDIISGTNGRGRQRWSS